MSSIDPHKIYLIVTHIETKTAIRLFNLREIVKIRQYLYPVSDWKCFGIERVYLTPFIEVSGKYHAQYLDRPATRDMAEAMRSGKAMVHHILPPRLLGRQETILTDRRLHRSAEDIILCEYRIHKGLIKSDTSMSLTSG